LDYIAAEPLDPVPADGRHRRIPRAVVALVEDYQRKPTQIKTRLVDDGLAEGLERWRGWERDVGKRILESGGWKGDFGKGVLERGGIGSNNISNANIITQAAIQIVISTYSIIQIMMVIEIFNSNLSNPPHLRRAHEDVVLLDTLVPIIGVPVIHFLAHQFRDLNFRKIQRGEILDGFPMLIDERPCCGDKEDLLTGEFIFVIIQS
jgi:hypothetical protein